MSFSVPKCDFKIMLLTKRFLSFSKLLVLYFPGFGIKFKFLFNNLNS